MLITLLPVDDDDNDDDVHDEDDDDGSDDDDDKTERLEVTQRHTPSTSTSLPFQFRRKKGGKKKKKKKKTTDGSHFWLVGEIKSTHSGFTRLSCHFYALALTAWTVKLQRIVSYQ